MNIIELEKEVESIKNLLDLYESEKKIISYKSSYMLFYVFLTQKQYDNLDFKFINNSRIFFEIINENTYKSLQLFDCVSFEKEIYKWFYDIEDNLKSDKYNMNLLCIKEVLLTVIDILNDNKIYDEADYYEGLTKIESDALRYIINKLYSENGGV